MGRNVGLYLASCAVACKPCGPTLRLALRAGTCGRGLRLKPASPGPGPGPLRLAQGPPKARPRSGRSRSRPDRPCQPTARVGAAPVNLGAGRTLTGAAPTRAAYRPSRVCRCHHARQPPSPPAGRFGASPAIAPTCQVLVS